MQAIFGPIKGGGGAREDGKGKMGERENSGTGREGDEAGGRYRVGAMSSGADAVVWSCAGSDGCHGGKDGGRWVEQHQRLLLKDLGG